HPDRSAVLVGENDIVEGGGVYNLIVGGNGVADVVGVEGAFRCIGGRTHNCASDFLKPETDSSQFCRINLNRDGGPPASTDLGLGDVGYLRNLLREEAVKIIINGGERQGL